MSESPVAAVPVWEAAKENVLPTKKGRSVGKLRESLVRNDDELRKTRESEESFNAQIAGAKDISARLALYVQYIKWARETFQHNAAKEKEVLEKFTTTMKTETSLYNDFRYVSLWIEYADLVRDPAEVFSFLYTNKVGERLALFWVAWAQVAERDANHKAADTIYQKGFRRLAEPKELLQKKYHQFQRRIARQFLNNSADVPKPEPIIAAQRKRRPLGLQEACSVPPVAPTQQTKSAPQAAPSLGFQIFDENSSSTPSEQGVQQWKNLGREAERRKENQGPAMKWSDTTLPVSAPAPSSSSMFIFVDEQFTDPTMASAAVPVVTAPSVPSTQTQETVKAKTSSKADLERVAPKSSLPRVPMPEVTAPDNAWMSNLDSLLVDDINDGTINTRLARQDIDLLFQSPTRKRPLPPIKDLSCIKAVTDRDYSVDSSILHCAEPSFLHLDPRQPHRPGFKSFFEDVRGNRSAYVGDSLDSLCLKVTGVDSRRERFRPLLNPFSTFFVVSRSVAEQQQTAAPHQENVARAEAIEVTTSPPLVVPCAELVSLVHGADALIDLIGGVSTRSFVHDLRPRSLPSALAFRTKYTGGTKAQLSECSSVELLRGVGRGTFGHAILVQGSGSSKCEVLKVDRAGCFVEWEVFIHTVLGLRLDAATAGLDRAALRPSQLLRYKSSSAMLLPFAELGTLIDGIAVLRSGFSTAEHEFLVARFAAQMSNTVRLIHSAEVAHCDLKTDNWVLRRSGDGVEICLIDFGNARLCSLDPGDTLLNQHCEALRCPWAPAQRRAVSYVGCVAAKGYDMQLHGGPWRYKPDYLGLACCLHQLLFFEPLELTSECADLVRRRGLVYPTSCPATPQIVPKCSLRRYWQRECWSVVYFELLHSNGTDRHADWSAVRSSLEAVMAAFPPARHQLTRGLERRAADAARC